MRGGALVLALALLVAGCSDDGGPSTVPPLAEDLPELPGPGAPLLDGYVVPEGAELLGGLRVGPQTVYDEQEAESSWYATFVVDGDPRVVIDDLLDQAVAAGLDVRSNCEQREDRLACSGRARRVVDGLEQERLEFAATRNRRSQSGSIRYQRWRTGLPEDTAHAYDEAEVRWSDGPAFEPPPLEVVGAYPEEGEPFPDPNEHRGGERLTVAQGAVVARPVVEGACGFSSLLYVPGDLEPVVDHYREQFDEWLGEDGSVEVQRFAQEGVETIRFQASEPGGWDLHFEAVVGRDGDPSWVTVDRCEDF